MLGVGLLAAAAIATTALSFTPVVAVTIGIVVIIEIGISACILGSGIYLSVSGETIKNTLDENCPKDNSIEYN